MQLGILVGQVEGNLLKLGRFRLDNYNIATPLLLRFGLVYIMYFRAQNFLESKFVCRDFALVTPFIHAT